MKIPKVWTGSFFPALLEPRRRIDVALRAVVMQAYIEGVSTRRVDDLVRPWAAQGSAAASCDARNRPRASHPACPADMIETTRLATAIETQCPHAAGLLGVGVGNAYIEGYNRAVGTHDRSHVVAAGAGDTHLAQLQGRRGVDFGCMRGDRRDGQPPAEEATAGWSERPALARAIRVLAFVGPVVLASLRSPS